MARDPSSTLEGFLQEASLKGEAEVARLRISICMLGLINLFLLARGLERLAGGDLKFWLITTVLVSASIFSAVYLRYRHRFPLPLETSVAMDGLLSLTVNAAIVWWPAPDFRGLVTIPNGFIFLIAVITSGFRLSRRAVFISAVINLGGMGLLQMVESRRIPAHATIPVDDIGVYWVIAGLSVMLALAIVERTRSLVMKGSAAVLDSERARQRLGMYVSQEIADQAMASAELKPGGQRQQVAVLFSDLRDFTRYSERLAPEQLVAELNAYLEVMLAEISAEGGVVDKYIGDAIMVVFGLPSARPDDAARAVRTAARMQAALQRHNAVREGLGQPPLRQGIGVHWGEVVAGNIGTTERLQYTVMGDTVNTASRLQSATKELGCSILVSAEAAMRADGSAPALVEAGPLQVRGRETPLLLYRLAGETA